MRGNGKGSNLLWIILAAAMVVVGVFWFISDGPEHIEDTNGEENYELAVITEDNIVNQDVGALGVKMSSGMFNDGITFSSKKFSGVYRIFLTNFLFDSDFIMDVVNFQVNSGNFKMCIVNEGKIIAEIEPDLFATCELKDLNGSFELIIAGESADFSFSLDRLFCEQYGIEIE